MKAIVILAAFLAAVQARSAHPGSPHRNSGHSEVEDKHGLLPQIGTSVGLGASRIVSGSTASRGQFPYQAAIYLNGVSFCAGSLVSRRWVLTAAQCASGVTTFVVYLGASNLSASESGRVIISTTSKIVHSGFNTQSLANDIALINLNQEVAFNSYIQPVPLAPGGTIVATNATGRMSGWSSSSRDNKQTASMLRYKDMVIVPNEECSYGSTGILRTSIICAKFADGSSTCNVRVGREPAGGVGDREADRRAELLAPRAVRRGRAHHLHARLLLRLVDHRQHGHRHHPQPGPPRPPSLGPPEAPRDRVEGFRHEGGGEGANLGNKVIITLMRWFVALQRALEGRVIDWANLGVNLVE